MDTRRTRRELADSVRLLWGAERWLFAGLAGGAVGFLIWIAGTGVAVDRVVDVVVDALAVDQRSIEIATLALIWVALPALVAVRYVVGHLTNIRGNIEQCYRFDQPLVLLVAPMVALAVAVVAAALQGAVGPVALVALGVATVFLLVRTVAYGYRVYSFSTPRLLQVWLFVAAVTVALGIICQTAELAGQAALVDSIVHRYGLDGTVQQGSFSAPVLPLLGATVPGILALAYVWVQIFASLVVRIRRPNVPRSAIRAGQRYPQVVQPGTQRRLAMGTVSTESDAGSNGGSNSGAASDAPTGPNSAGTSTGSGGSDRPTESGSALDAAGTDGGQTAGASEDDRFGQTRVYTPPEEADDDAPDGGPAGASVAESVKNELCPICGATYAADEDRTHCPNCNAVLDEH